MDRGHYFEWFESMSDADKRDADRAVEDLLSMTAHHTDTPPSTIRLHRRRFRRRRRAARGASGRAGFRVLVIEAGADHRRRRAAPRGDLVPGFHGLSTEHEE